MKNSSLFMFCSIFFTIIGILIIVLGIFVHKSNTKFLKTALQTEAVITRIDVDYSGVDDKKTYDVYISYTVNGKIYNEKLDEYHTGMSKGQTVNIYYNPENPAICHSNSTSFVGYLVIGFGVIWIILSLASLIPFISNRNTII